jgi:hypothetical protein
MPLLQQHLSTTADGMVADRLLKACISRGAVHQSTFDIPHSMRRPQHWRGLASGAKQLSAAHGTGKDKPIFSPVDYLHPYCCMIDQTVPGDLIHKPPCLGPDTFSY